MTTMPPTSSAIPLGPTEDAQPKPHARRSMGKALLSNGAIRWGGGMLLIFVFMAALAPWLNTIDPTAIDPGSSNLLPWTQGEFTSLSGETQAHLFVLGSDSLGRDIWSRALYGARVSLAVGLAVTALAVAIGLGFGVLAGYFRRIDGVLMRVMDGVMAIPAILFAVSLIALFGGALPVVVFAIAVPEIPRVARLVRSVVLGVREEPYVEAAIALDTPTWLVLVRHILPNAIAPLIIQATYVCATAILVEAILSFLGVGLPAETATWGNIMAEGRSQFNQYPHNVLAPGLLLALTVLSVNVMGDGLRDVLDPKFNKRKG